MSNCCGEKGSSLCENLECQVKETQKGIQVEITAKDGAKTESLKTLVKSLRDFCGCC